MKNKKIRIIVKLILLISWMIVIFNLSNQNGEESSNLSNGLLYHLINIITFNKLNIDNLSSISYILKILIRKCAHMFEYFVLFALSVNLLKEFTKEKILIYSFIFCLIFSMLDEFHQYFIPDRCASIFDVLIDMIGVCIFIILTKIISYKSLE